MRLPSVRRSSTVVLALVVAALASCSNGLLSSYAGQADSSDIVTTLPGAEPFAESLVDKLEQRWASRDADYKPRTKHLNKDGAPRFTNRLFLEGSPYLLQHAHNPVNWYPWGDEAFEEARRLGRPVLLSVGYSTCHWCHVMEEESFDNIEIARHLNENYVAIKVDREERPDVDSVYMSAVQAMGLHGGWPMTVWLTPDRQPFYAGTYFPPYDGDRGVSKGFFTLLKDLRKVYDEAPDRVAERAAEITGRIKKTLEPDTGESPPGAEALHQTVRYFASRFDATHGGTKGAPKFPSSLPVRLLLRYQRRTGDEQALRMATLTLEKMARGGMYDHIGGGFHRYSTDVRWLVPHFEKMLYDNALLVWDYLEAHQVTGRQDFARVAEEILRYVKRDMTSPEGAFYSATDADSLNPDGEREEGWFFTWTPRGLREVLGADKAKVVAAYYGVTEKGNFEGRNILHVARPLEEVARDLERPVGELRSILEESREELYQARQKRPPPLRDEKILTAWNGLMIAAHARAALILENEEYARRGARAADFILRHLRKEGRLLRRYKDGEARHKGYLDDYAFFIAGLLDLYEATGDLRWLQEAMALDEVLEAHYEDPDDGGFFMTSDDHEELLAREKPSYDGAEPSGNSIAVLNLLRLHEFTTKDRYRVRAEKAFRAFGKVLERSPISLTEMLVALDYHLDTPKEIILVTPDSRNDAEPLLDRFRETFLPNRILSVVSEGTELQAHAKVVPLLENKRALGGEPTAYVCENRVCELPTADPQTFARQIQQVDPLPAPPE